MPSAQGLKTRMDGVDLTAPDADELPSIDGLIAGTVAMMTAGKPGP
jgi:hypothetical protein